MQHSFFMALRKLTRERQHICNVDAQISQSSVGDLEISKLHSLVTCPPQQGPFNVSMIVSEEHWLESLLALCLIYSVL